MASLPLPQCKASKWQDYSCRFRLKYYGSKCMEKGVWIVEIPLDIRVLSCYVALISKFGMHYTSCSPADLWRRTWFDLRWRSVYRSPPALPLSYPLSSLTGSMPWTVTEWSQPSSVFCVRSKRKQVSFSLSCSCCVLHRLLHPHYFASVLLTLRYFILIHWWALYVEY